MSRAAQQKGVRHKGWLHKRGGRIHTWHKRWFVLTGDLLFYYKSPQDSRPTGTIPLAGNRVVRHQDDPKQPSSFKFEIISGGNGQIITGNHESYLICADSAEVADAWVTAIKRVVHEPYGGGMFGRSLEETMKVESRLGGTYVPILLHRCVQFIREHGLQEVGIFRLPGQASQIQSLKDIYDSGSQQDFKGTEDVHTVASLLKLYLRELPEPVVPFIYYDSYKQALEVYFSNELESSNGDTSDRIDQIKRLLIQLPRDNFNILKYLCRFLHEVESYSNENKMNVMNLGTIFGPHLLRPETDDPQYLMECNSVSANFVRAMLAHMQDLFPPTSDETVPRRLSVVFKPVGTPPWEKIDQTPSIIDKNGGAQRSLYQPKSHLKKFRDRQYTAPSGQKDTPTKSRGKKRRTYENGSSEGGRRQVEITGPLESRRNVEITGPVMEGQTSTSGGESPLPGTVRQSKSSSPRTRAGTGQSQDGGLWKTSPLYASSSDGGEDDEVPDMLKRFSQNGFPETGRHSDTLSSDIIVNSISTELETLEWQLLVARESIVQYKKASRLWKTRYEIEHRARLAAEHRVHDLQALIDETFQQFALDDSDDGGGREDEAPPTVPDLADLQNGGSQPLLDLSLDSTLAALKPYSSSPALDKYYSCDLSTQSSGN